MKLKYGLISNFKGVKRCEIDFQTPNGLRGITTLLGDNGSGKTTVLQAIGLALSLATRKTYRTDWFRWHGFLSDRLSTLGDTLIELTVAFDDEEIAAVGSLFDAWRILPQNMEKQVLRPSDLNTVRLLFRNGGVTSPDGAGAFHQFCGRYYTRQLIKHDARYYDDFLKCGDVFWFDQMRNLGQPLMGRASQESAAHDEATDSFSSWQSGVQQLRQFLVNWWAVHTSPVKYGRDYIPELEDRFRSVFPDVTFKGVSSNGNQTAGPADFYFLLERSGKTFDISEMSSGEQAVFPLMYEFVRLSISKSIVLVDELELHLHPPQQQALLAALPRIGPNCQYLITTHSPYLEGVIPVDDQVRLSEGRLCL